MGDNHKVMGIPQLLQFNTLLVTAALFIAIVGFQIWSEAQAWNSLWLTLILLAMALGLLVTSADFFIEGAKGLARRAGIPEIVIGLTIVSIGTSLPEILVTATAARDAATRPEVAEFAIGGIFGSVLVQISLILGIVVASKGVKVRPSWLKRDGMIMIASVCLLAFFVYTGSTLTRLEGFILAALYVLYIFWLLNKREEIRDEEMEASGEEVDMPGPWTSAAYLVMIVLGLSFAVFAAHHLVLLACDIAVRLSVPEAVIGTTISGLGTSLPELTIALMAARKSQGVAIGTLIGSNITDPLLSIGIAGMVNELTVSSAGFGVMFYIIVPATIISCAAALAMMYTSYEFHQWEGGVLILLYAIFLIVIELQRRGILVV